MLMELAVPEQKLLHCRMYILSAYRWSDSASKNMVPQHGKGSCMDRSAL